MNEEYREITFTDENIVKFCELTGDPNNLHNPEYMASLKKPKKAIVPGMMTLSHALAEVGEKFDICNTAEFYFNMLFSGDSVDIGYEENGDELSFYCNRDGSDLFSNKDNRSRIYSNRNRHIAFGREHTISTTEKDVDDFAELMQISDDRLAILILSIAKSSNALTQGIEKPDMDLERKLREQLSNGILPAYLSAEIVRFTDEEIIDKNLTYRVFFDESPENKREIIADVFCSQYETIFAAQFKLSLLPEKVLLRAAHDLN